MNIKYTQEDLEAVIKGELTIEHLAYRYNTSPQAIKKALYRIGYRKHKQIKIISPYKTIYVADMQKCAEELNMSVSSVKRALQGKAVPTLDELGIKLEVINENDK